MRSGNPPADRMERVLTDDEIVAAVAAVCESERKRGTVAVSASASQVAWQLGIRHSDGARRHGNGAVKGSYSGHMSASLRVAPSLRRLERQGRLEGEPTGYRWVYWPRR